MFEPFYTSTSLQVVEVKAVIVSVSFIMKIMVDIIIFVFVCPPADQSHGIDQMDVPDY